VTLQEAQLVIEAWRREYNEERTHSAIGDVTPPGVHSSPSKHGPSDTGGHFLSFGVINGGRSKCRQGAFFREVAYGAEALFLICIISL
jgi:hypothetical protein